MKTQTAEELAKRLREPCVGYTCAAVRSEAAKAIETLAAECKRWRDECGTRGGGYWSIISTDSDGTSYYQHEQADDTDKLGLL